MSIILKTSLHCFLILSIALEKCDDILILILLIVDSFFFFHSGNFEGLVLFLTVLKFQNDVPWMGSFCFIVLSI